MIEWARIDPCEWCGAPIWQLIDNGVPEEIYKHECDCPAQLEHIKTNSSKEEG